MSTSLAEPDLIEVADLEEMFAKDLICDLPTCEAKATWKVLAVPCGHSIKACTYHKIRELASFKMDYPNTYCHLSPDLRITELKPEPL